jgi:hypothetical protein
MSDIRPGKLDQLRVAIGDVNSDGSLDFAVANAGSDDVSVLLGNGDGSFQAALTFPAGSGPHGIAAGDLNGDGSLDLVTANAASGDVSVLLGLGNGGFAQPRPFGAGSGPEAVAIGDFNRDGHPDLAVANPGSSDVATLLGKGDGTFQVPSTLPGGNPRSAGCRRLHQTAAWISRSPLRIPTPSRCSGQRRRIPGPACLGVGGSPQSVVVGDLDRDGFADLVVANGRRRVSCCSARRWRRAGVRLPKAAPAVRGHWRP